MDEHTPSIDAFKNDEISLLEKLSSEVALIKNDREKLNKMCEVLHEEIENLKHAVGSITAREHYKSENIMVNEHAGKTCPSCLHNQHSKCDSKSDIFCPHLVTPHALSLSASEDTISGAAKDESIKNKNTKGISILNKISRALRKEPNGKTKNITSSSRDRDCREIKDFSEERSNKNDKINFSKSVETQTDQYFETKDLLRHKQCPYTKEQDAYTPDVNQDASHDYFTMTNSSGNCIMENIMFAGVQSISQLHEGLEAIRIQEELNIPKTSDCFKEISQQKMISLNNPRSQDVKLLLFGCSGSGKSSTINSLMGFRYIKTSSKMTNTEQNPIFISSIVDDFRISCIDTPGIEEHKNMSHLETIYTSLELFNHNFSGFLFVLKYGDRGTQQVNSVVKSVKGILGEKVIEDCCVCVMTHGELFENEMKYEVKPLSFQEWYRKQDSQIGMLFKKCKYRCVLFDNKTKDKSKRKSQFNELMAVVKTLKTYHKTDFESITAERETYLSECALPEKLEKANQKVIKFHADLVDIETIQSNDEKISKLKILLTDIDKLEHDFPLGNRSFKCSLDVLRQNIGTKYKLIQHNL